tara:strand:+ start:2246 stop:3862 length:1617 start_codon:yes stop_codon:yes gene_type:complete
MNLASELEGTIADRFSELDSRRRSKLDRARECAMLTIPSLMPPENWSEEYELAQPFSSVGSRGVTALASRMLSALIPLNDLPFFTFGLKTGVEPEVDTSNLLNALSMQVYEKMRSKNIREAFFQALQSLIVVGDVAVKLEEDFTLRCLRFDHYVAIRDVVGDLIEFIHLEFVPDETPLPTNSQETWGHGIWNRNGFKTIFCRYVLDEAGKWHGYKEDYEGNAIDEGIYDVFPYAVLRWNSVVSENYGRAKCEEIYGDLKTLEAYTESLIQGMAASSTFFMGVSPTGVTELTDLASAQNGEWVAARQEDLYVLSPAQTMNPQIQQTQNSVEMMRREIGEAFLMNRGSIRNAERVTATEVRMIGQELEQVLGGAFSSIARDLLVPLIKRTVFLMVESEEIDTRLASDFFDEQGRLTFDIITGLQALSRDTELQKLMQMGEMVRNLPEQAIQHFKFDEYGRALISALGFDPVNWVKSPEDIAKEQQEMMAQQAQQDITGAASQGVAQGVGQAAGQAVQQMAPEVLEQVMAGGAAPVQGGPM